MKKAKRRLRTFLACQSLKCPAVKTAAIFQTRIAVLGGSLDSLQAPFQQMPIQLYLRYISTYVHHLRSISISAFQFQH